MLSGPVGASALAEFAEMWLPASEHCQAAEQGRHAPGRGRHGAPGRGRHAPGRGRRSVRTCQLTRQGGTRYKHVKRIVIQQPIEKKNCYNGINAGPVEILWLVQSVVLIRMPPALLLVYDIVVTAILYVGGPSYRSNFV